MSNYWMGVFTVPLIIAAFCLAWFALWAVTKFLVLATFIIRSESRNDQRNNIAAAVGSAKHAYMFRVGESVLIAARGDYDGPSARAIRDLLANDGPYPTVAKLPDAVPAADNGRTSS